MPITLERIAIQDQLYAKSLLDNGTPIRTVARLVGIQKDVVNHIAWKQDYSASMLENFKKRLPYKFYKYADDMMDLVSYDEMKKAPIGTKMVSVGIAIDKARDMEGSNRPVFNVVTVVQNLESRLTALDTQEKALLALKNQ